MIRVHNVGYKYSHNENYHLSQSTVGSNWLAVFTDTPASFYLRGKWVDVRSHTLIIFHSGSKREYKAKDGKFCNEWFCFSFANISGDSFFEDLGLPVEAPIEIMNNYQLIEDLVRHMASENLAERSKKNEILSHYAYLFFYTTSDLYNNQSENYGRHYEMLLDIRERIFSNLAKDWDISKIAEEVRMSSGYFQHIYKECFGISIIADIINGRMNYADYLLSCTDMKIYEIAAACGYENSTHFMRQFKKYHNMTASEYRQQNSYDDINA